MVKPMTVTVATPFSLCGGHPVLDLVNTLDNRFRADGPDELLPDYRAVLAFMEQTGLLSGEIIARLSCNDVPAVAGSVRQLRESAATVLYAVAQDTVPPPAEIRKLEHLAHEAARQQELSWQAEPGNSKFVWEWRSAGNSPELPLWLLATQTAA